MDIRDIRDGDADWLHALNEACLPAVNQLSKERLWALVGKTARTRVAEIDGQPVGVAMTLAPGVDHDSMNYLWFDSRMDDFLYLDRIMVSDAARGRGVGKALYEDIFRIAASREGTRAVTCEVNLKPFNGGSLRFHAALGFITVGEQDTEGGKKAVCLLRRGVSGAAE
ncbi:MAG: GNAT family N-acetyltransferase [Alphaproteobacteria bacterium]|nr:GNAT family N-acetyltransferase [Alphaproteobacteria bacterium]